MKFLLGRHIFIFRSKGLGGNVKSIPIMQSHFNKLRSFLSTITMVLPVGDTDLFLTCGEDGTLRLYSAETRKCELILDLNIDQDAMNLGMDPTTHSIKDCSRLSSVALNPKCDLAAVGCFDGTVRIVSMEKWRQQKVFKKSKSRINSISFSPNGAMLATGANCGTIQIFAVPSFEISCTVTKTVSPITHIDWSTNSAYLQASTQTDSLLYVDSKEGTHLPEGATLLRNEAWQSWGLPVGWPVKGLFTSVRNMNNPICVDRSQETNIQDDADEDEDKGDEAIGKQHKQFVAVGYAQSCIEIFNYPCVSTGSQAKTLKAHSAPVNCVKFNQKVTRMFSTGSYDLTVMQWRVGGESFAEEVLAEAQLGIPKETETEESPKKKKGFFKRMFGVFGGD